MSFIGRWSAILEGKEYNYQEDFHYMGVVWENILPIMIFAVIIGFIILAICLVGHANNAPEHYSYVASIMKQSTINTEVIHIPVKMVA